jgi:TatD DNase family protein
MRSSPDSVLVNNMSEMHYVDTHAHLFAEEYKDDLDAVIKRTEEKHVDRINIITLSLEETVKAVAFAQKDPHKYTVSAGIFPEDVQKVTEQDWDGFVKTAADPRIKIIGEIGLDYYWEKDPGVRQLQRDFFIRQVQLANALRKPFAVHARDAIQDTFDIMKKYQGHGLLHCYSGTKEMAVEFNKLGYYIALGGALTFKNARHAVEVAQSVDEKYLLTETDCPYMSPEPVRGTRNEPSNIPYILEKMASVRNVSEEHMAETVENNWDRFLEMR